MIRGVFDRVFESLKPYIKNVDEIGSGEGGFPPKMLWDIGRQHE